MDQPPKKKKLLTEKEILKSALEILLRFNMAIKIAKIYEPNNLIYIQQIEALFSAVQKVLEVEQEASFTLRQSALFFNARKTIFSFSNYNLFRFISSEFQKKDMSVLNFKPGLSQEEIRQFVALFAQKMEKADDPFQKFLGQINQSKIKHINIEKKPSTESTVSNEKYAAKIFFLGITHLKEMFETLKKEERISLNTTRRLMQSMFNHIVANESFIYGLTNIKNFDEYTLNHSVNVCLLSISLGRRLGLDKNELVDLGISAFFHDFGKTEIPKEILVKPTGLDKQERGIIEKHPYLGAEKLVQLKEFSYLPVRAINVALEHHIKEDFSGYPHYQIKKDINLFSKIVKICDFFDALTTERPYRKRAFTRDEVLKMMTEKSGLEFDSVLLKVFVNMMGSYPVGSLVLIDTGEIGIVFEVNMDPANLNRPKVKIIADKEGKKIDGDMVDLTEADSQTKRYKRTIIKVLDPKKYNIRVSDYFLAQAQ